MKNYTNQTPQKYVQVLKKLLKQKHRAKRQAQMPRVYDNINKINVFSAPIKGTAQCYASIF